MRILITSTDHSHYNQTGLIVRDDGDGGVEVELDRGGELVRVANGQFKVTRVQP